jgi:hypothetical protein
MFLFSRYNVQEKINFNFCVFRILLSANKKFRWIFRVQQRNLKISSFNRLFKEWTQEPCVSGVRYLNYGCDIGKSMLIEDPYTHTHINRLRNNEKLRGGKIINVSRKISVSHLIFFFFFFLKFVYIWDHFSS